MKPTAGCIPFTFFERRVDSGHSELPGKWASQSFAWGAKHADLACAFLLPQFYPSSYFTYFGDEVKEQTTRFLGGDSNLSEGGKGNQIIIFDGNLTLLLGILVGCVNMFYIAIVTTATRT